MTSVSGYLLSSAHSPTRWRRSSYPQRRLCWRFPVIRPDLCPGWTRHPGLLCNHSSGTAAPPPCCWSTAPRRPCGTTRWCSSWSSLGDGNCAAGWRTRCRSRGPPPLRVCPRWWWSSARCRCHCSSKRWQCAPPPREAGHACRRWRSPDPCDGRCQPMHSCRNSSPGSWAPEGIRHERLRKQKSMNQNEEWKISKQFSLKFNHNENQVFTVSHWPWDAFST